MMHIEATVELTPGQRQLLLDLDHFEHVIFVSANAVSLGMDWIGRFWPQLPSGLGWYTVGAASAALLESYGLEVRQPLGSMDSNGLLARPELQNPGGQRILIVKGEGGRTLLHDTLAARGGVVAQLECYSRGGPSGGPAEFRALLDEQELIAILVSSGEGLDNMLSLLDEDGRTILYGILVIAPGKRVAEKARAAGFRSVIEALNATDEAMLAALRERV